MRKSDKNRELIFRALTDTNFRSQLEKEPAKALGVTALSPAKAVEIKKVLEVVRKIDMQIGSIADELLCANGGPCGIA